MAPVPTPHPMERQRRFPRIPSANTVLVAQVDGAQVDHFARTKTVGLGGCGFHYPELLVPGAIVELMIAVRPEAIKTLARVVYQHPSTDGNGFEVGVEFLALEPEHRRTLSHLLGPEAEESPTPL
jgi:PilZ domain-containing protein